MIEKKYAMINIIMLKRKKSMYQKLKKKQK